MKKLLAVLAMVFMLGGVSESFAWQPSGWVYSEYPWAYDGGSGDWYWFNTPDTQWIANMGNGQWARLPQSELASGWVFYNGAFAYSQGNGAWYWINNADTQWVVNMRTGTWSRFGTASAQGMLSVTFDDGWRSQYALGRAMLASLGVHATFYLNVTPFSGWPGYMQTNEVFDLIVDGHEIGAHTVSHTNLVNADDTNLVYELAHCRDFLTQTFGLVDVPSFASPYGAYDDRVIHEISNYYTSHRHTVSGLNWQDSDTLLLMGSDVNKNTQAKLMAMIDEASSAKGWLILVAHKLVSEVATEYYEYNVDDLAYLINYAKSKGLEIVTVRDGVNHMDALARRPGNTDGIIDDFEDGDLAGWYDYADALGSTLQKTNMIVGAGASSRALRLTWQLGTPLVNAYVGAGVAVSSNAAATADGISITSQGDSFNLNVLMSIGNDASYRFEIPASATWQTHFIPWAAFQLPSWSTNNVAAYPLLPSTVTHIEITNPAGLASGTNELNDLKFLSNVADIDNFEGFNMKNWYGYTDDGGSTLATNVITPGANGSYGAMRVEWELGTNVNFYVGTGVSVASNVAAFAYGLVIASRGAGFSVSVSMSERPNDASYQVEIPAALTWRTSVIPWSAFQLPFWSTNNAVAYPLLPSAITHIEITNPSELTAGTNDVDDLAFIWDADKAVADIDGDHLPDD